MTIIVKKPFELEPFDVKNKGIKDINDTANREVHPEFEEKPIMTTTQTSENSHGGSELTFSLPNSSQSSVQEQENGNNQVNQDARGNTSAPNNADTNNDNTNAKGAQEQPNDNNEVGDNAVNTDVDKQSNESNNDTHGAQGTTTVDNDADKQSNESGGGTNDTQEPQSTANDTNDQSAQQENANAEGSGDSQDSEGGNGNNDIEDQGQESINESGENGSESTNTDNKSRSSVDNGDGDTNNTNTDGGSKERENSDNETGDTSQNQGRENGDNNEQNSENDGEDEESESEDADEQSQSGTYNTQQVVDVVGAISTSKYYQTEFWRLIELIAEEKTRSYDPMGNEEFNIKKLMFRPYEKKPLSSYKMSRVKESVVILLDNSGSMRWWANNLQILADLAMQRNDVEVYLAPNGYIEVMIYPKYQLVNHDNVMRRLRNRKIIYVGDFDGADTPIILSWYNDVIWVCPEERYLNFLDHDWVHYSEDKFKGAFLRVFTLQELFSAFKKLLSTPALKIWYDLCNETHKCGGDEE